MGRVLITTGNGMFGRALARVLLDRRDPVRLMVRDVATCTIRHELAEVAIGDLDRPETLPPLLQDVDAVFLSSPMDPRLADREIAVIEAARKASVRRIVKIAGAVKHGDDNLARMHGAVLDALARAAIPLTLISPNSVMETSLLQYDASIKYMHAIFGMSGKGRIGLVALNDVAEATAVALLTTGHDGKNYELTGPESLDMAQIAERFSRVLGRQIDYVDMTEERLSRMIMKFDKSLTREKLELEILCHLRAWGAGKADLVTDTFQELTGRVPTAVDAFIEENCTHSSEGMVPRFVARIMRLTV